MRCPVCEANKDGKCMAGVIPYKSKKSVDGIGCNLNRRTVKKRMRGENMGGIYIPNMTEEMAKEHLRGFIYIPVPPHGRLIDADALKDVQQADADFFKGSSDYGEKCRYDEAINAVANIVNAPTIIPVEEGLV